MAELRLDGLEDLVAKLSELGAKASRIENQALRDGAEVLADAARQNVRVGKYNEKHIKDDIEVSRVKTKDGVKYIEVGPGKETAWRAKFLEFGHYKVDRKGNVMSERVPAYPFMGPAVVEKENEVFGTMADTLRRGLGL